MLCFRKGRGRAARLQCCAVLQGMLCLWAALSQAVLSGGCGGKAELAALQTSWGRGAQVMPLQICSPGISGAPVSS